MTMTIDDLKNLPPLSPSEKSIINNAEAIPTDDCPEMNEAELKEFKPCDMRISPRMNSK